MVKRTTVKHTKSSKSVKPTKSSSSWVDSDHIWMLWALLIIVIPFAVGGLMMLISVIHNQYYATDQNDINYYNNISGIGYDIMTIWGVVVWLGFIILVMMSGDSMYYGYGF